jgi:biotin carboxyl carrier protein
VEVAGRSHVIDVGERSADRFLVLVEGQELEVRLVGAHDLAEAVISPEIVPAATAAPVPVRQPAPETLPPLVPAAPPPLPARPELPHDGFRSELVAPMPGTVVSVDVAPGDSVAAGQVLLRLEAMKMANPIRAPQACRVVDVLVQAGQQVGPGALLLTMAES